jgi:hypothetical protein
MVIWRKRSTLSSNMFYKFKIDMFYKMCDTNVNHNENENKLLNLLLSNKGEEGTIITCGVLMVQLHDVRNWTNAVFIFSCA